MSIVTYSYYANTFLGEPIDQTDFPRTEARAERAIAQITHGRATAATFDALPAFQQEAVQTAICYQVEYYVMNGVDISINGETSAGWTVGKVSISGGNANKATGGASMVCAAAYAALEQTGLLDPSVPVFGMPPQVPAWWRW